MESDAEIQDYDEYYKSLFFWFAKNYIKLFYPALLAYIDLNTLQICPNEFFFSMFPGLSRRRFTDFIVQFALTSVGKHRYSGFEQFLYLIEPEKGSVSDLRPRMRLYHAGASEKYPKAYVFLTGLYIDVALDGIGYDYYLIGDKKSIENCIDPTKPAKSNKSNKSIKPETCFTQDTGNSVLCSWPYVGLPGLLARDYLKLGKSNPIVPGLIGFMKIEPQERQEIFTESFLQIFKYKIAAPQKILLARGLCMGMKLSLEEETRFKNALLELPQFKRNDKMVTLVDKIMAEGEAKGEAKGFQDAVLKLIKRRFGPPGDHLSNQIKALKPKQLEQILYKLINPSIQLEDLGLANGTPSQ